MLEVFNYNSFYMFIKTLDDFFFLNTPKRIQNVPPKKYIFLGQNGPHIVFSLEITQLKS
jgi:hypothetical protein